LGGAPVKMFLKALKFMAAVSAIILFIGFTFVSLMFYSNITFFRSMRELYVETAMTTMTHQYLATSFISKSEINRIMKQNTIPEQTTIKTNTNEIKPIQNPYEVNSSDSEALPETELIEISEKTYKGKLLIVRNPARVKLAVTSKLHKKGEKLIKLVNNENAIAGINASGFYDPGWVGKGGVPMGIVIKDGKTVFVDKAKSFSIIGFNKDNVLILGKYKKDEIDALNLRDAVSFSPFLIVNGEPQIKKGSGGWGVQPRTAIGQTKDGKVLMLVIDGRQVQSIGATLKIVQDILLEHGAYNAANLDGGSSTVMYYMDSLINKPCSPYGERYLPNAFVVK